MARQIQAAQTNENIKVIFIHGGLFYCSGNDLKFLIDGFPRNKDNYDGWSAAIGDKVEVPFMLHFNASEDAMTQRILERS